MTSAMLTRRIGIIAFIGGIGGGLVFPILPALGLQLGIPVFMIGLILSANRITRLVFNIPAGHVIRRLGSRFTLGGALLIETVGVLGYSAALHFGNPMWWLLGGRTLFGIGTAFLLVGAQAAVLMLSDKTDRGRKVSVVRMSMSAAMPAGLVMGGFLANFFSDDVAFLAGAGFTFAGALFAFTFLPRQSGSENVRAKTDRGRGSIAEIFSSPRFRFIASAWGFNFLIFLTIQGVLLATLILLVQKRQINIFGMQAEGTSGLVMAVLIGCSALVAFRIGRAIDKLPLRVTMVAPSLAGLAVGFGILAIAGSAPLLILGAVVIGFFFNGITLPMLSLLGDSVNEIHRGPAVGIYQFFGDIGGTIGPIAGMEAGVNIGLKPLYMAIAVLMAIVIPFSLWLLRYERSLNSAD